MTQASDLPDVREPRFTEPINQLIQEAGGKPETLGGKLLREIMQNCLRLARDQVDLGELKVMSYAFREMRMAFKMFKPYEGVRKISVFGSARTGEEHPQYLAAVEFSRQISEAGWMVITGAGDGIMRAGHGGAGREASFGVAIRLPFETNANDYIVGDEKLITHRYFFTRKLMFVSQADAVALFPGGFGTLDEGFEVLTLIQTGKSPLVPLVLVDEPGGNYWGHFDRYVREELLAQGMISPEDLSLYMLTDRPEDAVEHVLRFYRNYHSQRFIGDDMVLRLHRPLSVAALEALNADFGDLVADGRIRQVEADPIEEELPELPRLRFTFTRRSYGRLRMLIDRINEG